MTKTLCFHQNDEGRYWVMELEIRHLKLVREVSAAGSLTRAGAALHLTQSALSHQLRDIESRLGTPLFLRVGKRMMLTPAGERVLRSADEVLAAIERTEDAIRQLGGARRGVLRLTTECYTCYHWLPPLLKRFRRTHPHVDVRIDVGATNEPLAPLLEGRLDVAIVSDPVRDRRIVARPLFDDEMVVIVAPGHPLAGHAYVRPDELASETLLIYPPKEESTVYRMVLEAAGVAPQVLEMQLTEAAIELVKAGLGVAFLARWAVDPHVRAGTLRALPVSKRGYRRTWSAATLKDMARVPFVKEFIDLVAESPPFTARARGVAKPEPAARGRKSA
jgi:LysR family transcriptional regulator for metE and metH